MKDIKDYIGKRIVIQCTTFEEWDEISKLTGNTKKNYFNDSKYHLFDLEDLGKYWNSSSPEYLEQRNYEIYPASDFINTSLVEWIPKQEIKLETDKWYKAKNETMGNVIFQFSKEKDNYIYFYCGTKIPIVQLIWDYNKSGEKCCFYKNHTKNIELLTDLSIIQEFLPDEHPDKIKKTENTYCILLNSKEDLEVCEKHFNNLGYKATCYHNKFDNNSKYFIVYHNIKEYQNLAVNGGYGIKTMVELGIKNEISTIPKSTKEVQTVISNKIEIGDIAYYSTKSEQYEILENNKNNTKLKCVIDIKDNKVEDIINYNYSLSEINNMPLWKLLKKGSPTITQQNEKKGDDNSLQVVIANTAIDIIAPKSSKSVTLGKIQEEVKINTNFKKTIKI